MARYAITDIHGCSATFASLLRRIDLQKDDELYLLGDYIDRGPDSAGVLKQVWKLEAEGYNVLCLRGNHEQMLQEALTRGSTPWDYRPEKEMEARILQWINDLPYYHETPGYLLVHAGLDFRRADPLSDTEAMMWIRNWEPDLDLAWLDDRIVVYGHTPRMVDQVAEEVLYARERQRVCLDSGCAMSGPGHGHLSALNLDTLEGYYEKRAD